MIEGLDKDFELAVAIQIGHGGGGGSAIAVAVMAGVGQGCIVQEAAICPQDDEVATIMDVGVPVGAEISGEPSWFRSAIIGSEANMIVWPFL